MDRVSVMGHEVNIDPPDNEGIVTDVIVICRAVYPSIQDDEVIVASSDHTTTTVQTGILYQAAQLDRDQMTLNLISDYLEGGAADE